MGGGMVGPVLVGPVGDVGPITPVGTVLLPSGEPAPPGEPLPTPPPQVCYSVLLPTYTCKYIDLQWNVVTV